MRLSQTLKSASFKLTAAYAGLFAISVGVLAVVTYLSVKAELTREFQGRILAESGALEADYKAGGVRQVLPGEALDRVAQVSQHAVPIALPVALLVIAAWTAVAFSIGAWRTKTQEI